MIILVITNNRIDPMIPPAKNPNPQRIASVSPEEIPHAIHITPMTTRLPIHCRHPEKHPPTSSNKLIVSNQKRKCGVVCLSDRRFWNTRVQINNTPHLDSIYPNDT